MAATRLFFTASVEEQWRALAGPWLREQAGAAWKNPKPTVVLTPSRAESFYLRSRLVEEGVSFLGLRFWTPSDARKFLLGELSPEMGAATQAELRLVAPTCAERLTRQAATVARSAISKRLPLDRRWGSQRPTQICQRIVSRLGRDLPTASINNTARTPSPHCGIVGVSACVGVGVGAFPKVTAG
jgi:hypothetical protein